MSNMKTQNTLPDGWKWVDYEDLCGHLESPDGKWYFRYAFSSSWDIIQFEFKTLQNDWNMLRYKNLKVADILADFKKFAEKEILDNVLKIEAKNVSKSENNINHRDTIVVNAFGGPGAGKTTSAWFLASELKKRGFLVEIAPEYAKELVYDGNIELLDGKIEHEELVLQEKIKRIDRYVDKVDFVVVDCPLIQSISYLNTEINAKEAVDAFVNKTMDKWNSYDNFCFVVQRGTDEYQQEGRIQTLEESKKIDESVEKLLQDNNIEYKVYPRDSLMQIANDIVAIKNEKNHMSQIEMLATQMQDIFSDMDFWDYEESTDVATLANQIKDSIKNNDTSIDDWIFEFINETDIPILKKTAQDILKQLYSLRGDIERPSESIKVSIKNKMCDMNAKADIRNASLKDIKGVARNFDIDK